MEVKRVENVTEPGPGPDLDLQGDQADHGCAEGQRRGEVGAQVEEGKPVGDAGGADHAHHLENAHTQTLRRPAEALRRAERVPRRVCFPYQVDANVDQRAEVREEGDDGLPLQGQADPLDQAAGRLPLHLSPGEQRTHPPE